MAKKTDKDRERMIRLYENLGKFYEVSVSHLGGMYIKLAKAAELLRGRSKYYNQIIKIADEISKLIDEGNNALEINRVEVKSLKDGEPLNKFDYASAEKTATSYGKVINSVCNRASNVLSKSHGDREKLVSDREKPVSGRKELVSDGNL